MKCFYPFYKDGKCGFIDTFGNEIVPPMYEYGAYSTEGLAVVRQNGAYGFIDSNNDFVVPFCHEDVNNVREKSFFSWEKDFSILITSVFSNVRKILSPLVFMKGSHA